MEPTEGSFYGLPSEGSLHLVVECSRTHVDALAHDATGVCTNYVYVILICICIYMYIYINVIYICMCIYIYVYTC